MKVLITGASGFIGRILSTGLAGHELVLWSRQSLPAVSGAEYSQSHDLRDVAWWRNVEIPQDVDVVIHLAEPVKLKLTPEVVDLIVSSHCSFLENACQTAQLVIYPNTAYRYDFEIGSANRPYLEIKTRVVREFASHPNFISPVIHPLIDSDGTLARLVREQARVPLLNPFAAFDANIPVLTVPDLLHWFRNQIENRDVRDEDWYSHIPTVGTLMAHPSRRDSITLSKFFRGCLRPFAKVPAVSILLNGRAVSARGHV